MNSAIHLTREQVPAFLRVGYNGTKFQVIVCERVHVGTLAWQDGSRSTWEIVDLGLHTRTPLVDTRPFPANQGAMGSLPVPPGFAAVEHVTFQGRDLGLRIYVREENAQPLLPLPGADDMSHDERIVLQCTCSYKSHARRDEARRHGVDAERYDAAKASLIERGYLRKNGAVTVSGRNMRSTCPRLF